MIEAPGNCISSPMSSSSKTSLSRKRKVDRILALISAIKSFFPLESLYNWEEREHWGIGEDAFRYIQGHSDLKLI